MNERELWRSLHTGGLRIVGYGQDENECWLDLAERGKALSLKSTDILERFLLGEPQKQIAVNLSRSVSSVSGIVTSALMTLGAPTRATAVPAALVLLVNAAHDKFKVRSSTTDTRFTVARPKHTLRILSPCVRRTIELRFEGKAHIEIAKEVGGKSAATVHNQTFAAYQKLGVSNRVELIILLGITEP